MQKFLCAGKSFIHEDHNSIIGLDSSASVFRREGSGDEFEISFLEKPGTLCMYFAINSNHCKDGDPVMEVGQGESVKCKMEGDCIRIFSPRRGYLGFIE